MLVAPRELKTCVEPVEFCDAYLPEPGKAIETGTELQPAIDESLILKASAPTTSLSGVGGFWTCFQFL